MPAHGPAAASAVSLAVVALKGIERVNDPSGRFIRAGFGRVEVLPKRVVNDGRERRNVGRGL
jgi:hypothetical protein